MVSVKNLFLKDNSLCVKGKLYGKLRIPKKMPIESGFQGIWENAPLW